MNLVLILLFILFAPQVLRAFSLRRSALRRWRRLPAPTLAADVLTELAWWQTWNLTLFWTFIVFFIAAMVVSWFQLLPVMWMQILFAVYIGFGLGGLLHHFTARCPHCGMNIGVQSSLLLPDCCERCQAAFKK